MSEKRKLSDCVRPTVEAAPWVIDAILELESKLSNHIKREVMLRDALKEVQMVAESSVKTHGYDRQHVRNADDLRSGSHDANRTT